MLFFCVFFPSTTRGTFLFYLDFILSYWQILRDEADLFLQDCLFVVQRLMKSHYSSVKKKCYSSSAFPMSAPHPPTAHVALTRRWILQPQEPTCDRFYRHNTHSCPFSHVSWSCRVWGMSSILSLSAAKSKARARGRDDVTCLPYGHTLAELFVSWSMHEFGCSLPHRDWLIAFYSCLVC